MPYTNELVIHNKLDNFNFKQIKCLDFSQWKNWNENIFITLSKCNGGNKCLQNNGHYIQVNFFENTWPNRMGCLNPLSLNYAKNLDKTYFEYEDIKLNRFIYVDSLNN